jgi:hypothetical protein
MLSGRVRLLALNVPVNPGQAAQNHPESVIGQQVTGHGLDSEPPSRRASRASRGPLPRHLNPSNPDSATAGALLPCPSTRGLSTCGFGHHTP